LSSLRLNDPTERRHTMRHRPSLTGGLEFNNKSLDSNREDPFEIDERRCVSEINFE
jgi:hypothetical protein